MLNPIINKFFPTLSGNETKEQKNALDKLRSRAAGLVPPQANAGCSLAEAKWYAYILKLQNLLNLEDPRQFVNWEVLRETMIVGDAPYIEIELEFLRNQREFDSWWRVIIKDNEAISPPGYCAHPESSANCIHHAYHLARFKNDAQIEFDSFDQIIEFGGGYGNMCRLWNRAGHTGPYTIIDFTTLGILQEFYLSYNGYDYSGAKTVAKFVNSAADAWESVSAANSENSLFISTWGFSETPLKTRKQYHDLLLTCSHFLFGFQGRFEEVDNLGYFNDLQTLLPKCNWTLKHIEHLPNNYYLFGTPQQTL